MIGVIEKGIHDSNGFHLLAGCGTAERHQLPGGVELVGRSGLVLMQRFFCLMILGETEQGRQRVAVSWI